MCVQEHIFYFKSVFYRFNSKLKESSNTILACCRWIPNFTLKKEVVANVLDYDIVVNDF